MNGLKCYLQEMLIIGQAKDFSDVPDSVFDHSSQHVT